MAPAPMKLTLYNPQDDSVVCELSRAFIPTGIFSELVQMLESVDLTHPEKLDSNAVDNIYALVVEIFGGGRITLDQVRLGTDLVEVVALIRNIMARVESVMPAGDLPNPTPPGAARGNRKRH